MSQRDEPLLFRLEWRRIGNYHATRTGVFSNAELHGNLGSYVNISSVRTPPNPVLPTY
jgi:hypothetical protein